MPEPVSRAQTITSSATTNSLPADRPAGDQSPTVRPQMASSAVQLTMPV
jgi:hypothetical protein